MNKTISRYLTHNILYPKLIAETSNEKLGIVIVIPCYDEPNISESIMSIAHCKPPNCDVEVIVSINAGVSSPIEAKGRNLQSAKDILELKETLPPWLKIFPIVNNELPDKKAGVGLGRKIGMDEAVLRFMKLEREDGIVVCFDADSGCDQNYLCEIEAHFEDSKVSSASINYEHPIEGLDFSEDIYSSIVQYELHLRYFISMQKMINLPYAYHTVGSSMACTVSAYCAVGGMNQRKAGEDFYFIHKLVKFGRHTELNSTRVIPSPRISDRVPFGTGRAIGVMQEAQQSTYNTYHSQPFLDLKVLVDGLSEVYTSQQMKIELSANLLQFLDSVNAEKELVRILKNTSDFESFSKMFWHWFDAFMLMKYLHFVRDLSHPDIPVLEAVNLVVDKNFNDAKDALIYYRENDILS